MIKLRWFYLRASSMSMSPILGESKMYPSVSSPFAPGSPVLQFQDDDGQWKRLPIEFETEAEELQRVEEFNREQERAKERAKAKEEPCGS